MEELRNAFMLGYRRVDPWESCFERGLVSGSDLSRKAFMAGYSRATTWERYWRG